VIPNLVLVLMPMINEAKLVVQPMNKYEEYEMQWIGISTQK
jgi:hypothetical protein